MRSSEIRLVNLAGFKHVVREIIETKVEEK